MEPFAAKYRTIAVSLRRYYPEPWRGDGEFSLNQKVEDLAAFTTASASRESELRARCSPSDSSEADLVKVADRPGAGEHACATKRSFRD